MHPIAEKVVKGDFLFFTEAEEAFAEMEHLNRNGQWRSGLRPDWAEEICKYYSYPLSASFIDLLLWRHLARSYRDLAKHL